MDEFNTSLWFNVTIVNPLLELAPEQSCIIQVSTVDGSAISE